MYLNKHKHSINFKQILHNPLFINKIKSDKKDKINCFQ